MWGVFRGTRKGDESGALVRGHLTQRHSTHHKVQHGLAEISLRVNWLDHGTASQNWRETTIGLLIHRQSESVNVKLHRCTASRFTATVDIAPQIAVGNSGTVCTVNITLRLKACPRPLPKPVLHSVRSSASSFRLQYLLLTLKSSSSCLRLLPRLLVTCIRPPGTKGPFLSTRCIRTVRARTQFLINQPI